MLEGLVVAETVAQGLLQPGLCGKEPIVRGPAPPHLLAALNDLQLRAVAGQSVQPELWQLVEHLGDQATVMPGRIVDDEYDVGVACGGIRPADIPQIPCKRGLHVALPGGPLHPPAWSAATLHQARGQAAGDQSKGPEDVDQIMTIQVADDGAMPLEPQGGPQRGDHRATRLILTQQDQLPGVGCFSRPAGPGAPPLGGPGQL